MKKLLYIVKEVHHIGYEKLRIVPGMSPSGLYWRCHFISDNNPRSKKVVASNWLQNLVDVNESLDIPIKELTSRFMREYSDFLIECIGRDKEYIDWFRNMLNSLAEDELPYAYSDYFQATTYWKTSKNNKIETLPNEIKYLKNL